jgi:hypothetical protein
VSYCAVGAKLPLIKPDDLVRTPQGRTALCLELRPAGFRLLEDVATGQRSILHASDLYLVRSAPVKRWKTYSL